jgi:hypothetical protein
MKDGSVRITHVVKEYRSRKSEQKAVADAQQTAVICCLLADGTLGDRDHRRIKAAILSASKRAEGLDPNVTPYGLSHG